MIELVDTAMIQVKEFPDSGERYFEILSKYYLNALHIERVMDGIEDNTVPVKSTKAYLTAVLFNSLSTLDHFYSIQAKTEYSTPIYAQQSHQCY